MRNGVDALDDLFEMVIGQHQGIAAAEEHVPHLGRALDVADGIVDLGLPDHGLAAAHEPATGAMAAVHAAHLGDHEKHAVGVAMRDARCRRVDVLADGVLDVFVVNDEFGG